MTIYTTPLQFGYFLAWLLAILLWLRGWREERLSDTMLGFVLFLLAQELQDYTFGFAGINFLWDEMNGFPRSTMLLFGPAVYFYLNAQINRDFRFSGKDLLNLIPYLLYFFFNLAIFLQGKVVVNHWQENQIGNIFNIAERLAILISLIYYFTKSLKIYKHYRSWTETQFSDTEAVSFVWFRNFLYVIIIGQVFKWLWFGIDEVMNLDFYQDWWWNLTEVLVVCYVGIKGYSQVQSKKLFFNEKLTVKNENLVESFSKNETIPQDFEIWKTKILKLMNEDKIYLEPELSLSDLAIKLKTNTSVLSSVINTIFGKNFNDFINEFRVEEFKKQMQNAYNQHFTLLAIAFDCGFNSKATFNRAIKKFTGQSPKDFVSV